MKTIVTVFLLVFSLLSVEQFVGTEAVAAGPISVTTSSSIVNGKYQVAFQGNNLVGVGGIDIKFAYDQSTLANPIITQNENILVPSAFQLYNTDEAGIVSIVYATVGTISGSGQLFMVTFDLLGSSPGKLILSKIKVINDDPDNYNVLFQELKIYENAVTLKDKLTGSDLVTNNQTVSLNITDKLLDINEMKISEDPSFAGALWEPYAITRDITLSNGNGIKTVYVKFKDSDEYSTAFDGSILYDTTPPTGTLKLNNGDLYTRTADVTANLAFSDDSGLDKMQFKINNEPWTELEAYATTKKLTLPAVDTLNTVSVKVTDMLGNVSEEKSATITLDSPPTGSVTINNGDTYTKSTVVTLNITANDNTGAVTKYCVSNTSSCPSTSWKNYPPVDNSWALASGNGLKTVYVWFKDDRENVSAPVSDTITLDAAPPVNGILKLTAQSDNSIKLDWSGITDTPSGIDVYNLYYGTSAILSCSGTKLESPIAGNVSTKTHEGLTEGTTYYYRLCATDKAGNTNAGATASLKLAGLPTGTVAIKSSSDSNNVYTKTVDVTLDITGSDASGVAAYCVSNSTTCTAWITETVYPVIGKTWKLITGNGVKTVYVSLKDTKGNIKRLSDSITLDMTPPTNGLLKVTQQLAKKLKLDWSGISDLPSGVKEYKLVHSLGPSYPSCSDSPLYAGTGLSYTHNTTEAEGTTHYYRLCATDNAGNANAGATASGKAVTPPDGSVTINNDDAYTNKTAVNLTLTLNVPDTDGVKSYCVSNTSTCPSTIWPSYPPKSNAWTLTAVNGLRTVYVWFKDNADNISPPVTDSITLDSTAPAVGKLTVTQPNLTSLKLDWTAFSDSLSGMKGYELYHSTNALPAGCSVVEGKVEKLFDGAGTTYTHAVPSNDLTHYYRLCGVDNAGNKSSVTASRKVYELDPPTGGSLSINSGAEYATSATVKLAFGANDASGVKGYCVSNTNTCPSTSWKTLTAPLINLSLSKYSWTLPSVNSSHTVSVWFRDIYGNVTEVPATATILLDTVKPAGKLIATQLPGALQLDWSDVKDNILNGIKEYRLYESLTAVVPSSCSGELLYVGTDTSFTHTSLNPGTLHYYRLCATDKAGNTGSATVIAKAVPELGAPNGSVVINKEGDVYANTAVTLAISATDTSGVAAYCVSNTFTCPKWYPGTKFPVIIKWNLLAGKNGDTRMVNVWFKDKYGIVTPDSVWDEVTLDITPPAGKLTVAQVSKSELTVDWSGISDMVSGVNTIDTGTYVLRHSTSGFPASCSVGDNLTPIVDTDTSFSHTGLISNSPHYYRFCVKDKAGNLYSTTASGRTLIQ